jgi:phospholipase/lecithinase/hemolysin
MRCGLRGWRQRRADHPAALTSIAGQVLALTPPGSHPDLVHRTLTDTRDSKPTQFFAAVGHGLTQAYNGGLDKVLNQLSALPGVRIDRLDAYRLLNDIVANPPGFGLTDTTTACITPDVAPFFCQAPDAFLFWDGIHPTQAAHALIAAEAAFVLSQ